jgi:hypothetical protein
MTETHVKPFIINGILYDVDTYEEALQQSNDYVEPIEDEEFFKQNEIYNKIYEAKEYLASTDFKMTADYDKPVKEVKKLRKAARELIRSYED